MKVHVRDPRIAPNVVAYIERMGFSARATGDQTVEVLTLDDTPDKQARRELALYLGFWRAVEERDDVMLLS